MRMTVCSALAICSLLMGILGTCQSPGPQAADAGAVAGASPAMSRQGNQGLVAHWDFEEGSGTVLHDKGVNGLDGTINGGAVWTTGINGTKGLHFDGVDDSVEVPNNAALNFGIGNFSYSLWVKLETRPTNVAQLLCKRQVSGGDYEVQVGSDGVVEIIYGSSAVYTRTFASTPLEVGIWYMITVTRGSEDGFIYINDTMEMYISATQDVSSPSDLYLGEDPFASENLKGAMDEVRIYGRNLSAGDVDCLFHHCDARPDLSITTQDIAFSNDTPALNTVVRIDATIRNNGGSDAYNVEVWFYDGNNLIGSDRGITTLGQGKDATISLRWNAAPVGVHTITVKIDPNDTISESNETNNKASRDLSVQSLEIPDMWVTGDDIVPSELMPYENTTLNITVTIHMTGFSGTGTAKINIWVDSILAASPRFNLSSGNDSKTRVATVWRAVGLGNHTISAVLDPDAEIRETHEDNNIGRKNITVLEPPPGPTVDGPDLMISPGDISINVTIVRERDRVKFSALVHNNGRFDARDVVVRFQDDGSKIGSDFMMLFLAGNGSTDLATVTWVAEGIRNHEIKVLLDPDGNIAESNEGNNVAATIIPVVPYSVPGNNPPLFTSTPGPNATVGIEFVYTAAATDPDWDVLTFSLVSTLLPGMTMDNATGTLAWRPGMDQVGDHTLGMAVSDGRGGSDEQWFQISVNVLKPVCTITYPKQGEQVSGLMRATGTTSKGAVPVLLVKVRIDGEDWLFDVEMDIHANWSFRIDTTSLSTGDHKLDAVVIDRYTESDIVSVTFYVGPASSGFGKMTDVPWDMVIIFLLIIPLALVSSATAAQIRAHGPKKKGT